MLKDKTVLITGGTGSFGQGFVNYLLQHSEAKKIIVFSRDELKQSQMRAAHTDRRLRFFLGDVRDLSRLQRAFYGVDIVVHAAALKQVPTLEYNPFEAIKTNVLGTQNVIDAAVDQQVEKVVFISTDKAAQPVNLYGASKLCAEKLVVNGNAYAPDGRTKLSCVRYGNVIGSRGSVVEILKQRAAGGTVQVTDYAMTRFWLPLSRSFELVLFALHHMQGGEIFVPKVASMKVSDVFGALAPDAEQEEIGIRPGEKLHEILITPEESRHAVSFNGYFVILPEDNGIFDVNERYRQFLEAGEPLTPDVAYASDTNDWWFEREEFRSIAIGG